MNVFLGITGASGAPYAARLLDALVAADVEVGLCASSAGLEVVATELYGDPDLDRDEVLRRFSSQANIKLRDLAAAVIEHRRLPDLDLEELRRSSREG